MDYMEMFSEYWKERFKYFKASRLIEAEQWLSTFIDSDLFEDSMLSDEALAMYELVRDECVHRVAKISDNPFVRDV